MWRRSENFIIASFVKQSFLYNRGDYIRLLLTTYPKGVIFCQSKPFEPFACKVPVSPSFWICRLLLCYTDYGQPIRVFSNNIPKDFALISHFFYKEIRFLYILKEYLFGFGVWVLAVNNFGSRHHASVVRATLHIRHTWALVCSSTT